MRLRGLRKRSVRRRSGLRLQTRLRKLNVCTVLYHCLPLLVKVHCVLSTIKGADAAQRIRVRRGHTFLQSRAGVLRPYVASFSVLYFLSFLGLRRL